ncbi:MAG: hypothetical protein GY880_32930 [Planctomycetaceae bacterium]|nr:hypothetical protein [Planctomycetaceae bacterium]
MSNVEPRPIYRDQVHLPGSGPTAEIRASYRAAFQVPTGVSGREFYTLCDLYFHDIRFDHETSNFIRVVASRYD